MDQAPIKRDLAKEVRDIIRALEHERDAITRSGGPLTSEGKRRIRAITDSIPLLDHAATNLAGDEDTRPDTRPAQRTM